MVVQMSHCASVLRIIKHVLLFPLPVFSRPSFLTYIPSRSFANLPVHFEPQSFFVFPIRMRFSLFAIAATLALSSAQDLGNIPTCALSCFAVAVPASGCSLTDAKCQCTTGRDSITESITKCVPGKCSADEIASRYPPTHTRHGQHVNAILEIAPAVQDICASAGITVSDLPTAVNSGSAAGSATGSIASRTASVTGSSVTAATQSPGAGAANHVAMGAVALGLAAVFGL